MGDRLRLDEPAQLVGPPPEPGRGPQRRNRSRSSRCTEVAALFYTLLETARLSGVDPAAYLRTAMERALEHPGRVTLPDEDF